MKGILTSVFTLLIGLVFGAGLVLSGMIDTQKVIGFLDVAGAWNPALAFVMGGAVVVAVPLFYLANRRGEALLGQALERPASLIDARLIIGAAIFGIGWGLAGICPGPGIVWLGLDPRQAAPFVISVIVGAALARLFGRPDKAEPVTDASVNPEPQRTGH